MRKANIKEYRIWKNMKSRCYAPCNKNMGRYQKIGVIVCDEWKNSYEQFAKDMGKIPSNEHTIERIDTEGNYEPSNCKWIHKTEQSKNRGAFNRRYSYNGVVKNLKDWARHFGIKYTTLYMRIRRGSSFEESINNIPEEVK